MQSSPASALAALYAYESRVPAIARTKAQGLKEFYGADAATARYFTLHQTADVEHARVWREAVEAELEVHPEETAAALDAAEQAAERLWAALDGIERERLASRQIAA